MTGDFLALVWVWQSGVASSLAHAVAPSLQQTKASDLHWWQVVGGILAIPTAILGLWYTFVLSQKIRLETKKLQNDLLVQEGKPPVAPSADLTSRQLVGTPGALAVSIQDFILRFIILELTRWMLGLVFGTFISPLLRVAFSYSVVQLGASPNGGLAQFGLYYTTNVLYDVLSDADNWAVVFLLGWPLLADITKFIGVSPTGLLRERGRKFRRSGG